MEKAGVHFRSVFHKVSPLNMPIFLEEDISDQMKRLLPIVALAAGLGVSCTVVKNQTADVRPPLADTLWGEFSELTSALMEHRLNDFFALVDPDEAVKLQQITRQHGYSSLKAYLENQLRGWPDPDTLAFSDVISTEQYARLTIVGSGCSFRRGEQRLRYTFLLFKRSNEQWKLAAMSTLEKDRYDPYGYEISYHETDLPSRLRFPRVF